MQESFSLIYSSCPDEASARQLAAALLDRRLAACVSILPGVRSLYEWQGRREESEELLLMIKAPSRHYAAVESCLRQLHPYELPEIIAVPLVDGFPGYLAWVSAATRLEKTPCDDD